MKIHEYLFSTLLNISSDGSLLIKILSMVELVVVALHFVAQHGVTLKRCKQLSITLGCQIIDRQFHQQYNCTPFVIIDCNSNSFISRAVAPWNYKRG